MPVGVSAVRGRFERGQVVACVDENGNLVAKGLVNYDDADAAKIIRTDSRDLDKALGYIAEPEMIHRDNLAILYPL